MNRRQVATIGFGLAGLGVCIAESQGNLDMGGSPMTEQGFQWPDRFDYTLNPGSPVKSWLDDTALPETQTADPALPEPVEGNLTSPELQGLAQRLREDPASCPEDQPEYQQHLAMQDGGNEPDPNTLLCLNTSKVQAVDERSQLLFPLTLPPSSGLLLDIPATLNTNPDYCTDAMTRLTRYAELVIDQTGLLGSDKAVDIRIMAGDCGTYQAEQTPGREVVE
ncbi:MAG TPA: hypothetical protein VK674_07650 [Candidatus Limnocylindria bacterium]|nr:hypothetical protein [Candidatus Limnocylindria bacterium]